MNLPTPRESNGLTLADLPTARRTQTLDGYQAIAMGDTTLYCDYM